jgi:glycosyltransferase involved in cell wall biosynthesis
MKNKVVKLIDYTFQHERQLAEAYDDSNSLRYLSSDFDCLVVGRLNCLEPVVRQISGPETDYRVVFYPASWSCGKVLEGVCAEQPDVIHMHGYHKWPQYPFYAEAFRKRLPHVKLIFSPAGNSCGTPEFISFFDKVVVNHLAQAESIECYPEDKIKIVVRKRTADPRIFYPLPKQPRYDFVCIAGFVPVKRLDLLISYVRETPYSLVLLGDFTRTRDYYRYIADLVVQERLGEQVFLHDFISQTELARFLVGCRAFVWPNIAPENPVTTTNRAVIEALACGLPLLLGSEAFFDTEFVVTGINGFLYNNVQDF